VKRLWRVLSSGKTLAQAADKANMGEKTARRSRDLGRLPGEVAPERTWRTRKDPFADDWRPAVRPSGVPLGADALRDAQPERGHKEYLAILYLAARQSETAVFEPYSDFASTSRGCRDCQLVLGLTRFGTATTVAAQK
jgi:hypothetical protein